MRRFLIVLALGTVLPMAAQTTTTDKPADKPQKADQKSEKKSASADEKKSSDQKKTDEKKSAGTKTTDKSLKDKTPPSDVFPDIQHERVDYWVAAFSKMKDYHKKIAGGFERKAKYQDLLERKLRKKGMPQNLIYLAFEESAFNCEARSREKANGIWQLTAATARLYGLKVNKKVDQRMNVEQETDAALRFLNHLHNRFGSWYLAAAAYDAGENRIARLMRRHFKHEHGRDRDYYRIWDDLPGETRDYVPAIVALKRIGQNPSKYGF
jgi:membrane-bound lytic murein transglycosylase D